MLGFCQGAREFCHCGGNETFSCGENPYSLKALGGGGGGQGGVFGERFKVTVRGACWSLERCSLS